LRGWRFLLGFLAGVLTTLGIRGAKPPEEQSAHSTAGPVRRRLYEPNPKHRSNRRGTISAEPASGQEILDLAVRVKPTSSALVGIDYETGDFVVFREHLPNTFHGYVVDWKELTQPFKNALIRHKMVNERGRIL
jgi:hypothetical protein